MVSMVSPNSRTPADWLWEVALISAMPSRTVATISRMDGAFGLADGDFDPAQGGLAALPKTVMREWEGVNCRALDVAVDWTDAAAAAELQKVGGKDQAPCLVLQGKPVYEAPAIVELLAGHVAPLP